MNEFLEQFLIESRELVEQATTDLLALEHDPGNAAFLDGAFRAFHTLKGAAGIMDFTAMSRLTHEMEDLLASMRSGERKLSAASVTQCLSGLDQIVAWLDAIEAAGELPEDAGNEIPAPAITAPKPVAATLDIVARTALPDYAIELLREQVALISPSAGAEPPDAGYLGRLGAAGKVCRSVLHHFGLADEAADIETALALLKTLIAEPVAPDVVVPQALPPVVPGDDVQQATARSLRVDVGRIEEIVKITGELIVATNALGHEVETIDGAENLRQLHARFNRLTSQLLRSVLATRVLPLQRVFQRFPRLLREIAARLNKPVRLVTEGEATEADKVIVEAMFEPILHVMRNAIDHGVEPLAKRRAAAKPETATITLRGRREGDRVVIEVEDDGGGIDLAAIRDIAVRRRLITKEAAGQMPDAEILKLIFLPGFSTAATLSDISGRGVGMDAVRASVERLGGSVSLQSAAAIGTTVSFIMPFTVMMTRVLTVQAGGQRFGIPFDEVVETVQLPADQVVSIGAAQAIILHDRTIPLLQLAAALDLAPVQAPEIVTAAVVKAGGGELVALQVDSFGSQLDVILKPMDGLLAGMPGIAGSTVTGDGQVLIVLELRDLLR